jgi:hypothetical protein
MVTRVTPGISAADTLVVADGALSTVTAGLEPSVQRTSAALAALGPVDVSGSRASQRATIVRPMRICDVVVAAKHTVVVAANAAAQIDTGQPVFTSPLHSLQEKIALGDCHVVIRVGFRAANKNVQFYACRISAYISPMCPLSGGDYFFGFSRLSSVATNTAPL